MKTGRWVRRAAAGVTSALCLAALLSDFISPVPPDEQNLAKFYYPPTGIHLSNDGKGAFVYGYEMSDPLETTYRLNREARYPIEFFARGYRYRFLGLFESSVHLMRGTDLHLLGTDALGRDVLSRVLAGSRTSLLMVSTGVCIYALLGLTVGLAAGVAGGWVDATLMRLSEFVLALPVLYLILALRALLPLRLPFWQALLLMAGAIAGVTWPAMARGVRGLALQISAAGYVEAARSSGSTRMQIIGRHMIPRIPPFVFAQAVVAAPVFLLGEVVLSFLDVGIRDSGESWGVMMQGIRSDPRIMTDFWWNLAPLVFIFLTLFGLNSLARRSHAEDQIPGM